MNGNTKRSLVAAAVGCLALVAAGCGSSSTTSSNTTSSNNGLKTESTVVGQVLATTAGLTVYELVGATPSHSACTGGCLSIWPSVTDGGHQIVVNGHPAYRFSGDTAPGQTHGQGLHDQWGKWWALGPGGVPIMGGAGSTGGSTSTTSSGGYGY